MNASTITMPPVEARAALAQYRRGLKRRADVEYEQAALAYEHLAAGLKLLVLSDSINMVPRDDKARPKLAIARADQTQVCVIVRRDTWAFNSRFRWTDREVRDGVITVPRREPEKEHFTRAGYALVPMVPPDIQKGHALDKHFVLWEVERWADSEINPSPDRDPYLLRRLSPDLFAIVGEWELTEVERMITAGRASGR